MLDWGQMEDSKDTMYKHRGINPQGMTSEDAYISVQLLDWNARR